MSINSLDKLKQCIDTNNEINITTIMLNNNSPAGFNIVKILEEHLEKFVNLKIFTFFGDNDLDTFLVKLFSLKKLEKLSIRYVGGLTTLPKEIGNLVNLKILILSDNNLTTLPNEIGNLENLTELDLENNKLTTLPNNIGNLVNLKDLALNNNELETLPEGMLILKKNLKRIDVLNNIFNDRAIQIIQTIPIQPIVNNQGIAFEVHNEFKKIFGNRENSFIVLLNSMIKSSSPTKTTFDDIIPIVQSFVSSPENLDSSPENLDSSPENLDSSPKKLVKLNQVLERFGNSSESKNPKTIEIIAKTIQYVNEQPIEFKHLYSNIFIQDCFHAYNGDGNTLSCVKGIKP
jgi:Leucine-rich repeat (LRR) protein